ncbi:MAG TPA: M42 family peptidase, partial [Limnochordia bacterium]|nr:M42 family peptidase [Limnochordia bacterium]
MAKSISDHLLHLSRAAAPSGYEAQVRDYLAQNLAGLADETSVDPLGNLIAVKRGTRHERLLLAAHMDEIGFMVTHVDEHGFLRFATLGGHTPRTLIKCRVRSTSGVQGMIDAEEETGGKEIGLTHLYIDIGAASKDEAEQLAGPGTPFVFDSEPVCARGMVIGKALDDRAGCAVLLSVLEALAQPAVTVV